MQEQELAERTHAVEFRRALNGVSWRDKRLSFKDLIL